MTVFQDNYFSEYSIISPMHTENKLKFASFFLYYYYYNIIYMYIHVAVSNWFIHPGCLNQVHVMHACFFLVSN